jgi:hypothetical protein
MALLLSGFTLGTLLGATIGWLHRDKTARKFERMLTNEMLEANERYADLLAYINTKRLTRVK